MEAQLGLIGGTMGLLTGFSILSGVEIIYYFLRSFSFVLRQLLIPQVLLVPQGPQGLRMTRDLETIRLGRIMNWESKSLSNLMFICTALKHNNLFGGKKIHHTRYTTQVAQ